MNDTKVEGNNKLIEMKKYLFRVKKRKFKPGNKRR